MSTLSPSALQNSWQHLLRLHSQPCLVLREDGGVIQGNPAAAHWFAERALPVRNLLDAFEPSQQDRLRASWRSVEERPESMTVKEGCGMRAHLEVHSWRVHDTSAQELLFVMLAPQETFPLPQEDEAWQQLLDAINVPIVANSVETGHFVYANRAACELLDVSFSELQRNTPFDYAINTEDTLQHIQDVYEHGHVLRRPVQIRSRKGTLHECEISVWQFLFRQQLTFLATIIPEDDKVELRRQQAQQQDMLEVLGRLEGIGVWTWDHNAEQLWLSETAQRLLGVSTPSWSWPQLLLELPEEPRRAWHATLTHQWKRQQEHIQGSFQLPLGTIHWQAFVEYSSCGTRPIHSRGCLRLALSNPS
jgi:PAS domain-containing protein